MSEEVKNTNESTTETTAEETTAKETAAEIAAEGIAAEEGAKKPKTKKNKSSSHSETLKAELEKQKELLMRTAAEFDNFKKRTEREKLHTAEYAKASVIKTFLPVLDNADRALAADPESPDYIKGIEMIVKQMRSLVDELGILELAEVGDTFNPEIHEAVLHIEDEQKGESEIVAVLQQGYKLGDTVIRHAMVQVAN